MKGYDDDTTKTHPDGNGCGGAAGAADRAGPRTGKNERRRGYFAPRRLRHLDRSRRRQAWPSSALLRPDGSRSPATSIPACLGALSKGRGRSASGLRAGCDVSAGSLRAATGNDHGLDHQLQRIDDVRSVDQRRRLVQGSERGVLHEHADQRAAQSRLRFLIMILQIPLGSRIRAERATQPGTLATNVPTNGTPDLQSGVSIAPRRHADHPHRK